MARPALLVPAMISAVPFTTHVPDRNARPAAERRIVSVEARELADATAREAERSHLWTAARPCAGDDIGLTIAVHVAARDEHAATKEGIVAVEAGEFRDARRSH